MHFRCELLVFPGCLQQAARNSCCLDGFCQGRCMGRTGGRSITLACRKPVGIGRLGTAPGERSWAMICKANNAAYVRINMPYYLEHGKRKSRLCNATGASNNLGTIAA